MLEEEGGGGGADKNVTREEEGQEKEESIIRGCFLALTKAALSTDRVSLALSDRSPTVVLPSSRTPLSASSPVRTSPIAMQMPEGPRLDSLREFASGSLFFLPDAREKTQKRRSYDIYGYIRTDVGKDTSVRAN